MTKMKVPKGWNVAGELPKVDLACCSPDELAQLDEDLLHLTDPSGAYILDVGWYPSGDPTGRYVAHLVHHADWGSPVTSIESSDAHSVERWLQGRIADVQLRSGRPGAFTTKVGVFIYAKPTGNRAQRRATGRATKKPKIIPAFLSPRAPAPNPTAAQNSQDSVRPVYRNTSRALAVALGEGLLAT